MSAVCKKLALHLPGHKRMTEPDFREKKDIFLWIYVCQLAQELPWKSEENRDVLLKSITLAGTIIEARQNRET